MNDFVVDVLTEFLGEPRKHTESKGQIAFDCPSCAEVKGLYGETDGKGNLEINYHKGVYKCWACYTTQNMQGSISYLIRKYGNKDIYKRYQLVKPKYEEFDDEDKPVRIVDSLPAEYVPLTPNNEYASGYWQHLRYCRERGITDEIIKKHKIGFANTGKFRNRVIIPSYDDTGVLNYFVARSILHWVKPKYNNPETPKDQIIFNHSLINPNSTIYLVEGPMDSIVVPNCIPLLGLFVSDKLYWYLQTKAKANVVIILDGEAKEEADRVYKMLNTLHLFGRVKIIYLKDKWDMSKVHQKYGKRGIRAVLTQERVLDEFDY